MHSVTDGARPMITSLEKISDILRVIRTPLALTGLVILVVYAIYKQVLELKIFSQLSEPSTFQLLNEIVTGLFWLAVISIILGVLAYLVSILIERIWLKRGTMRMVDEHVVEK
jgi:hypothetical protein